MPAATDLAIHGCTCARLRRLNRRLTAVYDRTLAPLGLRVTQYSLLSSLRRAPRMTLTELASLLDMDRTTLTRNLKPLVDAGWVDVHTDAIDTRARYAQLTAAGAAHLDAARPLWRRAQDEVNDALGRAQVAQLHALVDDALPRLRPAEEGETGAVPPLRRRAALQAARSRDATVLRAVQADAGRLGAAALSPLGGTGAQRRRGQP